jgi:hypothetical protein
MAEKLRQIIETHGEPWIGVGSYHDDVEAILAAGAGR